MTYDPRYLEPRYADDLFERILREVAWRQDAMTVYGRTVPLPRLTAWYGDPHTAYRYSGIQNDPLPWTAPLAELRDALERSHGIRFNSVLLNRYRSGRDRMGWHADDERVFGRDPVIASVSLGATRRFQLRHRTTRETVTLNVEHGSLVMMSGPTQHNWKHQVPVDRGTGERINLTFRIIDAAADRSPVIPRQPEDR